MPTVVFLISQPILIAFIQSFKMILPWVYRHVHTYIHTYRQTYIDTYIHTYLLDVPKQPTCMNGG